MGNAEIIDSVVWFKSISSRDLLRFLDAASPDEQLILMADEVVGPWQRMRPGKDGRPTLGIRPIGPMKEVWREWYRTRRGQRITLRPVTTADDYLAASAPLFSEWNTPEDEEAFGDL